MTLLRIVHGGRSKATAVLESPEPYIAPDADRALLARIVERDFAAHKAIFDRYYKQVFSFVLRRVRDEGLVEEITADVFFEVWRNAAAYRGESPVSSWIFGIANLKALSARRFHAQPRRSSVRSTADDTLNRYADPIDHTVTVAARQELTQVLRAFDRLPEGQRDVLRLAFLEGLSYPEVAEVLAISEANVKTRVNRARSRLRTLARHLTEE
jgi:RNA polymerase sigma-70 factor, ECF subfamily